MEIQTNISFRDLTTINLGGPIKYFATIHDIKDIEEICNFAKNKSLPIYTIGGGSNVIAKDYVYNGIVVQNCIKGFEIISKDEESTIIKIGAGENWDSVVEKSVSMNLSGIEAMSAIPGTAGATPVQNVGAYGQEISDTISSLEAYDKNTNKIVHISNSECKFSYRNSIFKEEQVGRYIITSITIKLKTNQMSPPFYNSLQKYLDENKIFDYTPQIIRKAVIEIRKNKLPDPKILPNCGSFFKNIIINSDKIYEIKKNYPDVPVYEISDDKFKIPAGWLIERSGLKGKLINGIRIYENNAMILVNESANSYDDLHTARNKIIETVKEKFDVIIEQEPIEIQ
ncbi:MAG TPA: UDP-N-acetylmuramate dehydrogenase [Candidatus Saccharibacteria bacterium]|nr:UDP-N-acetylmuramate dehydrogenase [Candidatus Saccharibacteria bacterium]